MPSPHPALPPSHSHTHAHTRTHVYAHACSPHTHTHAHTRTRTHTPPLAAPPHLCDIVVACRQQVVAVGPLKAHARDQRAVAGDGVEAFLGAQVPHLGWQAAGGRGERGAGGGSCGVVWLSCFAAYGVGVDSSASPGGWRRWWLRGSGSAMQSVKGSGADRRQQTAAIAPRITPTAAVGCVSLQQSSGGGLFHGGRGAMQVRVCRRAFAVLSSLPVATW